MSSRHQRIAVLLVLIGALAVAAVALGGGGSSSSAPEVESAQQRAFAILRSKPQPPAPALAARMGRAVETIDFGLVYSQARRVRTRIGRPAWVIPGRGFICVMGSEPIVAGCNTTAQTVKEGMSVVAIVRSPFVGGGKRYELYGVAPDGIDEVAVATGDGRKARVPVVDNVYSYEATSMIRARLLR